MSNILSNGKNPIIAYVVPNERDNFARVDEIDDTLNQIFTSPKELSFEAEKELNYILCEIDKIYLKNSKDKVQDIYNQMSKFTADAQEMIFLEEELSYLFIKNKEVNINIIADDEILLEKLNTQVDALYKIKELNNSELYYADALFGEKKALFFTDRI